VLLSGISGWRVGAEESGAAKVRFIGFGGAMLLEAIGSGRLGGAAAASLGLLVAVPALTPLVRRAALGSDHHQQP
jgi:hypothetical protein